MSHIEQSGKKGWCVGYFIIFIILFIMVTMMLINRGAQLQFN